MPVSYQIYPALGLVHVRYSGFAWLADTFDAFESYARDPAFRAGQKHLVDLTRITDFERDYTKLLSLQAKKAEAFCTGPPAMLVYLAPTATGQRMARLIVRSWEQLGFVVPRVLETEADALSVLGLRERSLDALAERSA